MLSCRRSSPRQHPVSRVLNMGLYVRPTIVSPLYSHWARPTTVSTHIVLPVLGGVSSQFQYIEFPSPRQDDKLADTLRTDTVMDPAWSVLGWCGFQVVPDNDVATIIRSDCPHDRDMYRLPCNRTMRQF